MKIVIVGNSPLAFFVARGLNNDIARYAHLEVMWLTDDRDMAFPTTQRLIGPNRVVKKSAALPNIKIVTEPIRSISLPAHRIVTEKRVIDFELIFFDQTPWYTQKDLSAISQALQKLIVQIRAKKDIRAAGAVRLKGESPLVWQLSLTIKQELTRLRNRSVSVEVERPRQRSVTDFLNECGVGTEFSNKPGFTVAEPLPAFPTKRIKGIRIDRRERAVTDGNGIAATDALVAEHAHSDERTLFRALEAEGRILANQMERLITRSELLPIEREPVAFILRFERRLLARLERIVSTRLRARLLYKLDHDFWKKLAARHG